MNVQFARAGAIFLSLVCLAGCSPKPAVKAAASDPVAAPVYNDTAQFLAGLPGRSGGPFATLEQTDAWKKYSTDLGKTWARAQKDQFSAVDVFQKSELAPLKKGSFVFYPFSGPDVLYAVRFFPDAKLFVMAGLERVGSVHKAEEYAEKDLDKELNGFSIALSSIFNRSFFVTREMDSHFHGKVADGLMPMFMLLLARSGYIIEGVGYGNLDKDGKFLPQGAEVTTRPMGVQIRFFLPSDKIVRTIYYFSTKLGPEFAEDPSFSNFVKAQGTPDTLLKSASFLPHWHMCDAIREQILATSNVILEDDTGIVYHHFLNPTWKVQLYGQYSRPDPPFTKEYQKDLAEAFADPANVKPLGFSIGYGAHRRPSSLILATRVP